MKVVEEENEVEAVRAHQNFAGGTASLAQVCHRKLSLLGVNPSCHSQMHTRCTQVALV